MMSVVTATEFTPPVVAPSVAASSRVRMPRLATRWLDSATAVIVVEGEVDAANADAVGDYAAGVSSRGRQLVLDLSRLDFFGVEGFSVLRTVGAQCAANGVQWVVVPGPAVARVLRLCDPAGALPTAGTVDAAVASLPGTRRPLTLVTG